MSILLWYRYILSVWNTYITPLLYTFLLDKLKPLFFNRTTVELYYIIYTIDKKKKKSIKKNISVYSGYNIFCVRSF